MLHAQVVVNLLLQFAVRMNLVRHASISLAIALWRLRMSGILVASGGVIRTPPLEVEFRRLLKRLASILPRLRLSSEIVQVFTNSI
jgi:hypothetical protein